MTNKKHIEGISEFEFDFICEFIKLRNNLGFTQQEMADKVGVLRDKIAKIEAGIYSPNLRSLAKILEPLGYRIAINKVSKDNN